MYEGNVELKYFLENMIKYLCYMRKVFYIRSVIWIEPSHEVI